VTAPDAIARAPGRVNLIGEHTDYNGGLVLPAAIELGTRVVLRLRDDDRVVGRSRERGESSADRREPARGDWLDYPRGVARELERIGAFPQRGFALEVESTLPEGAGLSSSAALEAASALALLAAAGSAPRISRAELAQLCQRAEADFVGVPCGIMDQFTVLCSEPGRALRLDCATLATRAVALPPDWAILIFDSGVERSLRAASAGSSSSTRSTSSACGGRATWSPRIAALTCSRKRWPAETRARRVGRCSPRMPACAAISKSAARSATRWSTTRASSAASARA